MGWGKEGHITAAHQDPADQGHCREQPTRGFWQSWDYTSGPSPHTTPLLTIGTTSQPQTGPKQTNGRIFIGFNDA